MGGQRGEFLRFAVVGVLSNIMLYAIYLALTSLGVGYKAAMSLLYVVGVTQTFVFNKRWSFRHRGGAALPLLRYGTIYAAGYAFNLAVLVLLVDMGGLPHQIVQGVMIPVLAVGLFLLQKHWVFRVATP